MIRRALASIALGAVVLMLAAPPAPALTMMRLPTPGLSTIDPSKITLVGGPLLAGSAVFWAEGRGSAYGDTSDQGPLSVVVANRAGRRGAALTLPTVGPGRRQRLTSLAASPTRLAAVRLDSPDDNGNGFVSETYIRAPDGVHQVDLSGLMRRMVKENLLKFDGTPLFPERIAYTVPYKLSDAEARLYREVTEYVREEFNRAEALQNDKRAGTVGFALTILQRRLASSSEAIYQSLRRLPPGGDNPVILSIFSPLDFRDIENNILGKP